MTPESVRNDIPLAQDLVYLDAAATSLIPRAVLDEMYTYDLTSRGNVGRGVHRLSQITSQLYWDAHETVSRFINGSSGTTVFTLNATHAINQVASGLDLKPGDQVVTTLLEHHSNLLPWMALREKGVEVRIVTPDDSGFIRPDAVQEMVSGKTRLIACTHASNVLGTVQPVTDIAALSRDSGAALLVDAAQSVPHIPVDVMALGCDYLCFSGHKMLGPTGTGVLWMKEENLVPAALGGGMIREVTPEGFVMEDGYARYEAGTPNVSGAVGLRKAVKILSSIGMETVAAHEAGLTARLIDGISGILGVTLFGPGGTDNRIGVVSFLIEGLHPHETAHILDDQYDIMVRSGHHCCMPLMTSLGCPDGTVRASLALYNTQDDVDRFITAVREIAEGI